MKSPETTSPPDPLEGRLEAYLEGLLAGSPPDLEQLCAGLEPARRGALRARALAEEFLMRQARGESVLVSEFQERLDGADERALFAKTLDDQLAARRLLPGDLLVGFVLDGRYEIRRELGEGGMGRVYAALDRELEREVAIKVLRTPLDAGQREAWEEGFRRESRTLARLESRSIVTIHDVRRGSEHSYFVMDLVPGLDLRSVIERARAARSELGLEGTNRPEPLRQAIGQAATGERANLLGERTHERCVARLMREAVRGIEEAHAAGVVHRDLKPQNVLVLPGGEPMLLDFGLASWRGGDEDGGFHGTPEYLAPEQVERQSTGQDPRSDVWQLGLLLYELLTLQRAFPRRPNASLFELFERIRLGACTPAREPCPWLSPSLEAILARALALDPEERYAGARELREDLDRFLARRPPRHARLSAARSAGLWTTALARHPGTWALVGALLAAFLFFRPRPWAPPLRMEAFRAEGGTIEQLSPGQTIEVADSCILGLEVVVERPTWLYVFSLFVPAGEDQRRVRPVAAERLEDVLDPGYAPRPIGPLRIEPGETRVACALLRRPDPREGLLAIACEEEEPALARLQEKLLERERTTGQAPTEREAALLESELGLALRGEPLAGLSAGERSSILGQALAPGVDPGGSSWHLLGWVSRDFLFEVRARAH